MLPILCFRPVLYKLTHGVESQTAMDHKSASSRTWETGFNPTSTKAAPPAPVLYIVVLHKIFFFLEVSCNVWNIYINIFLHKILFEEKFYTHIIMQFI